MSVTGCKPRPAGTFDALLEFKDAGLVESSAAAQVDATAKVVDLGTGLFKGCMIIDVSAIEIASNDESYTIVVQGSPDSAFTAATSVELCSIHLGAKEIKLTDTDKDDGVGRFKLYFDNENNGTRYRYARLYTVVSGSVAGGGGINYAAYAVPLE